MGEDFIDDAIRMELAERIAKHKVLPKDFLELGMYGGRHVSSKYFEILEETKTKEYKRLEGKSSQEVQEKLDRIERW